MIDAIEEGREHTCSGWDGLQVMEAMMGCFISHFEGRHVSLPLEERGHPLIRIREEAGLGPVDTDVPTPRWCDFQRDVGRRWRFASVVTKSEHAGFLQSMSIPGTMYSR